MDTLHIFYAGCVKPQVLATVERFERAHPDVKVQAQGGGSVDIIRRTKAGQTCDLLVSADDAILASMMLPDWAQGYRVFAGNAIVVMAAQLGYTICADNWMQTLLAKEARFGHFEPTVDPGGYRAVMACLLADGVQPGLTRKLLEHPGRQVIPDKQSPRPPYIFMYRTFALHDGAPFAELPVEMNLEKDEMESLYRAVSFDVGEICVQGGAIRHALTIPKLSPNKPLARAFAQEFLRSDFAGAGFVPREAVVGKDPLQP